MIKLTGIGPSNIKDRSTLYFDITLHEGESIEATYNWVCYMSAVSSETPQQYLESKEEEIAADIEAKEAYWLVCPKTKEIEGPDGEIITVEVLKSEIVCPTFEKENAVANFRSDVFLGRLIQVFPGPRWFELSMTTGLGWSMVQLLDYPGKMPDNIVRFKEYLAGVVLSTKLTQDEADSIAQIMLELGIDLSKF